MIRKNLFFFAAKHTNIRRKSLMLLNTKIIYLQHVIIRALGYLFRESLVTVAMCANDIHFLVRICAKWFIWGQLPLQSDRRAQALLPS
jgi:hypothetical protein